MKKLSRCVLILLPLTLLGAGGCEPGGETEVSASINRTAEDASGSRFADFGDYVVHYNALTTDQLPPDVARAYGIVRSKSRAMVNVVIIKKVPGTIGKPVSGDVRVTASNLTGQLKNLTIRPVIEDEAIYYIGHVPVSDGETLVYDVSVTAEGETENWSLRFKQQFYTE